MRILYVSMLPVGYNTSAALRNIALITGLLELGHEVHILNLQGNSSITVDEGLDSLLPVPIYSVKINNISELATKIKGKSRNSKALSAIRHLYRRFAIYDSFSYSIQNIDNIEIPELYFDLIISSSDPRSSHILADEYIKRSKLKYGKWVQYWGDPWAIDINNKSAWPQIVLQHFEKKWLEKSDLIFYTSPLTLEKQKHIYRSVSGKMHYIPTAYLPRKGMEYERKTKSNSLKIGYFGDYNSNLRNIRPLYEACCELDIEVMIVGNTNLSLESKDSITLLGRQEYSKIVAMEAECDILVCICNLKGTQVPGKVYHYAGSNKTILVIAESEQLNIIKMSLNAYNHAEKYLFCENKKDRLKALLGWYIDKSHILEKKPLDCFLPAKVAEQLLHIVKGA